jgi:CO/xanthine dehydrogenase Mo-binding subunit
MDKSNNDEPHNNGADNSPLLARREFLKTTTAGALVIGFGAAEIPVSAQATGAGPTGPVTTVQRGVVSGPFDEAELDSYIAVHPDNTVTIFSGYVELGQGGPTALRQIAAEELDVDFDQVQMVRHDTFVTTNGLTLASMTVAIGGTKLRVAASEARRVLVTLASERLKAPVQDLTVSKGVVSVKTDPQRSITYGDLLGGKAFNHKYEPVPYRGIGIELPRTNPNNASLKPRAEYKIAGTRVPRFDIPDKVRGTYVYMQHVRVPGMLHGRVVWPQGQGAYGVSLAKVISVDDQSLKDIPGARIVRRQNFVGVVAEREWDAVRAAKQLKVTWEAFTPSLPGTDGIHDSYRTAKSKEVVGASEGNVAAALTGGAHVVSATYRGPYQSHGPMAPNCAVADVRKDSALVMCSDQAIYGTRNSLAKLLGLPIQKIRVQYYPGSNTFGSSCYADVAQGAAIMSQEVGRPVRLQFSRQDEFGWDNYGPAHLADIRAAADAGGKIVAFDFQAWGHGTPASQTSEQLALGAAPVVLDPAAAGFLFSLRRSQNDMYDIPNRRLLDHRFSSTGYFRVGALRAPMDPAYFFAQEGMIDELAYAAQLDPYDFRTRNISNPRWLGVLRAAAEAAKWTSRVAASSVSSATVAVGRGIGLGTHHIPANQGDRITFAAAVVEIEVNKGNGVIVAKHIYGAMDCGFAVNPAIVESQIVGMSVHGASMALKEEVKFNETNVTSLDWNGYQTLRFGEHPAVTPIVLQKIDEPSTGAGEEVLPAVVAAIGNAFFDATGVRLRQFPMTPPRVLAALKAAASRPERSGA